MRTRISCQSKECTQRFYYTLTC